MRCVYCQREIGNNDKYELFGGDPVHVHCFQIIGVELTDTPWEEMLPREQDALNLHLSENAEQPSQE